MSEKSPSISLEKYHTTAENIILELQKIIVGQEVLIHNLLVTLLAGGNALLEGVPGLGKTMLIKTLSEIVDCSFNRIQFTPDLMPADITGTMIITEMDDGKRGFRFEKGPVFANLILADEINRATPRTQSALLEAMQEQRVTISGESHFLPMPFFVLATQNPIEMEGTYPLPEAQLDRFLYKIDVPFQAKIIWWRSREGQPAGLSSRSIRSPREICLPPCSNYPKKCLLKIAFINMRPELWVQPTHIMSMPRTA